MDSDQVIRRSARRWIDGRHPIRGQLLQRGCLLTPGRIRSGMVWGRTPRALFQGRRIYSEVGTELGYPALPVGRDADTESGLVAAADPRRAKDFPCLSDRSRARLLP